MRRKSLARPANTDVDLSKLKYEVSYLPLRTRFFRKSKYIRVTHHCTANRNLIELEYGPFLFLYSFQNEKRKSIDSNKPKARVQKV